jgi:hypothetical protein
MAQRAPWPYPRLAFEGFMSYMMTPDHPKWEEFMERMTGPEACDFKEDPKRGHTWICKGGNNRDFAKKILADMGADVEASLDYFSEHGGHCDCEIAFNVDR